MLAQKVRLIDAEMMSKEEMQKIARESAQNAVAVIFFPNQRALEAWQRPAAPESQ